MPVISAGAEAQEAERGWASSPAGQTSGQRPQSSPQSRWGSQASELCLRGMEGSGWTAAGGPFRFPLPRPPPPTPPASVPLPPAPPFLAFPATQWPLPLPAPQGVFQDPWTGIGISLLRPVTGPRSSRSPLPPSQPAQASCHRRLLRVAARKDGSAFPEHHCCPPRPPPRDPSLALPQCWGPAPPPHRAFWGPKPLGSCSPRHGPPALCHGGPHLLCSASRNGGPEQRRALHHCPGSLPGPRQRFPPQALGPGLCTPACGAWRISISVADASHRRSVPCISVTVPDTSRRHSVPRVSGPDLAMPQSWLQ